MEFFFNFRTPEMRQIIVNFVSSNRVGVNKARFIILFNFLHHGLKSSLKTGLVHLTFTILHLL